MGEDVAVVGDCKGVAVNAQLEGYKQPVTHRLIKFFVILTDKIFVFETKLSSKEEEEGVINPCLDK